MHPLVEELPYNTADKLFSHFADWPWAILLDSAQQETQLGRFSFIAVDPFLTLESKNQQVLLNQQILTANPFELLKEKLQEYPMQNLPEYAPFQGGAAGYFGYDLCHHVEKLPRNQDDNQFADLMIGFYDLVIAVDSVTRQSFIFSSGFPEKTPMARRLRAEKRLLWLKQQLQIPIKAAIKNKKIPALAIQKNFTQTSYQESIQRTIEYIEAGEIFQANISQRFSCALPKHFDTLQLYHDLRQQNPAPFAAYLHYPSIVIASASPERFLKLTGRQVETRPIKGTRPRGKTQAADEALQQELHNSEKDRAENIMIVDVLRNDLARVCRAVQVKKLCAVEKYATVHHLVSVVTGELQENLHAVDLLRATFPGGSITGAPKIRAMEIIAEIEPTQRGPYCGCIGYIGFNGDMDLSIVIRTYTIKDNLLSFQAGGGVVVDSDPLKEYAETLLKAQALCRALTDECA